MPPSEKLRRATMGDVAAHAGVSKATVSAVLNASGPVQRATRDRVWRAIEQLDYHRPAGAGAGRAIMPAGACGIGFLVRQADDPHAAAVLAGARAAAGARGYTLLAATSEGHGADERRAAELLRGKGVAGLLLAPVLNDDADLSHLFDLVRRRFPFVLLDTVRGVPASCVGVDRVRAARGAADHLIALGHTRLAHFAGPASSADTQEHIDGVLRACSAARVPFTDADAVWAGARLEDGYRAALDHFRAAAPAVRATGVTCYNDLVAVGVCRALAELGLEVPGDVSVVGFGDAPLASYLPVPLTSVCVPACEMGRLAVELLLEQMRAEAGGPTADPSARHVFGAELVVRASTRAPGAARGVAPYSVDAPGAPPPGASATRACA